MGFERRTNGFYFYIKNRKGKKVTSTYVNQAAGEEILAFFNAMKEEQAVRKEAKREEAEYDEHLNQLLKTVVAIIDSLHLCEGYRWAKSTWKRKREFKKSGGCNGRHNRRPN